MNFKRYRDSIIASIVLAASLLVSVVCYASILENMDSEIPKLGPIALGDAQYNIYQNELCTGHLTVSLEHDKSYHLLIDTNLNIKSAGKIFPVRAMIEGYFNAIGQLQAGKASLNTNNSQFKLESEGVTPMKLNIDAKTPFLTKNFDLDLPGPIEIVETSKESFGIRYAAISGFSGISQNINKIPIEGLRIQEASKSNEEALCDEEKLEAIDANQLFLSLSRLSGAAAPYLQEFSK